MSYNFGNPLVHSLEKQQSRIAGNATVSINGVVARTFNVFAVLGLAFSLTWIYAQQLTSPMLWFGAFAVAMGFGLFIAFKQSCNPALIYGYAIAEGVILSLISQYFEARYPGIIFQAVLGVAGCILAVLFLYKTKIIQPTKNFMAFLSIGVVGIAFAYMVSIFGSFFGWRMPILHDSSPAGILVSIVIVVIASLTLVVDFKAINDASGKLDRKYEWFFAFSLMVSLVWMYVEILRLLAKLRD